MTLLIIRSGKVENKKPNNAAGIVYIIGLIVLLPFVGYMWYNTWTLGSGDDDYTTVCIDGHEYNYASFATKGFLAIRLNDDGKTY